ILNREIPGRFVYEDDQCAAFLTIAPLQPGHTLVVPRLEVDHWPDLPPDLAAHLFTTAQKVGRGIQRTFPCEKVGVAIIGLEVPHVHIHLSPINAVGDLDFSKQNTSATPEELDEAATKIRAALAELGIS